MVLFGYKIEVSETEKIPLVFFGIVVLATLVLPPNMAIASLMVFIAIIANLEFGLGKISSNRKLIQVGRLTAMIALMAYQVRSYLAI